MPSCANPILRAVGHDGEPQRMYPCGQCLPCRVNIRRKKTARFLLEQRGHLWTSFVTLTIDDAHLEYTLGVDAAPVWTVRPRTVQLAIKRMRRHSPDRFRYVAVGEYGNRTGRPHYHMLVYGPHPSTVEAFVDAAWTAGHAQTVAVQGVAQLAYVAGYTVKKLTQPHDSRLDGNHPEFYRQSLKPAIGDAGLDHLEALHYTRGGAREVAETGDVMKVFRQAGKQWPLDRWTRDQLRQRLGIPTGAERPKFIYEPPGCPADDLAGRVAARKVHDRMARRQSKGSVF